MLGALLLGGSTMAAPPKELLAKWLKNPSPEALARKARSEKKLAARGIHTPATLPALGASKVRTQQEVVERLLAITVGAVKGEGLEQPEVEKLSKRLGASPFFSPQERAFVTDPNPSPADKAKFGWRYECLGVLLWAVTSLDELGAADQIVDAGTVVKLVVKENGEALKKSAKLRSKDEILDAADLAYREDWACVDARVNGRPAPKGLDCEIVVERHYALNWLIGYLAQDWDDVSTDT
jgi:Domain of unknown function (DUF4272)